MDWQTDRPTDGQMDESDFIGRYPTNVERRIVANINKWHKTRQTISTEISYIMHEIHGIHEIHKMHDKKIYEKVITY